jgi:O-antigen/teichoic acid export membrane protein
MLAPNFVSFFTVQGFFIGIVFGLLKSDSADGLFTYAFLITSFFYLFSHLVVAFYFKTLSIKNYNFAKNRHESDLDRIVKEINKREKVIDSAYKITDAAIKMNTQDIAKAAV